MRTRRLNTVPILLIAAGALVVGLAIPAAGHEAKHLINGSSIKKHSIAGNRLKTNTLTGSQINESTLATVPKATLAGAAKSVNGQQVVAFSFGVARNGAAQSKALPGVVLTGSCADNQTALTANATSSTVESLVFMGNDVTEGAFKYYDASFSTTSNDELSYVGGTTGAGTAVIRRPNNQVTTINYAWEGASDCIYSGTAIGS